MENWLSYSPQDFLLFSERTYWRLFELHNAALWPAQVAAVLAGLATVVLLVRRPVGSGRMLAGILAVAWAVTALAFLPRYATINWAAGDLIPLFLAQAAMVAVLGLRTDALDPRAQGGRRWIAVTLIGYGMAVHPVLTLLAGRPVAATELFSLTPDPTAIVTLGVILAAGARWPAMVLLVVPLAWCLASWTTLATLGAGQAWVFAPIPLALLAGGWLAVRAVAVRPGPRDAP
jgi:hypothetical protein